MWNIENHLKHFPNAIMVEKNGRLGGVWYIGNCYQSISSYHGSYPHKYLERVYSLFPGAKPILHLFSGSLSGSRPADEWTVDVNCELDPDVCCDAVEIHEFFAPGFFSLVLADPPYDAKNAQKYGFKLPNMVKVMKSLHRVVKPGGIVAWLCTMPPIYQKELWGLAGSILVRVGTNKVVRSVELFERKDS